MHISRLFASNILWRGTYLITSMLVTVLMARYLQAYTTGWLFYFITWLSFFFLFASASIESSITYFVASGEINRIAMQWFVLLWILFISVICFILASAYFKTGNEFASASSLVFLCLLFITGNALITFFNAFFFAASDFITSNAVFIVCNLLLIALLTAGINGYKIQFGSFTFLELYFFSFLLQGFILVLLYVFKNKQPFRFQLPSVAEIKKIFAYSVVAVGANLLFFAVTRIDYFFIETFTGDTTGLGNYIQASRLVQLFQLFPGILAATIFPLAASGHQNRMKDGLLSLSRVVFALYLAACLFLIVTGKWLFPFLFGETFNSMYDYFLLLIPGLFALASLSLISAYFAAINKIKINLLGSLAAVLVIITGNLLLIPRYGITAAAITSSAGYIVCFGVAARFFYKETGIPWISFFKFGKADLAFLVSILKNLKNQPATVTNENAIK